jgi:tripartite-type tricarboxylate transporter receptor subunit TctC
MLFLSRLAAASTGPRQSTTAPAVDWKRNFAVGCCRSKGPTPPAIINKLNAEIVAALKDPETQALLEKQAMQTVGNLPEAFAVFIRQDIPVWKQVAEQAKVEVR